MSHGFIPTTRLNDLVFFFGLETGAGIFRFPLDRRFIVEFSNFLRLIAVLNRA
jgi:hypothetical protein